MTQGNIPGSERSFSYMNPARALAAADWPVEGPVGRAAVLGRRENGGRAEQDRDPDAF